MSTTVRSSQSGSLSAIASDTQLASTVAGVTSRVLLHPIDSVKTRLQHLRGRPGQIDAGRQIIQFVAREGIGGLYRGILGALVGVIPYSMCTCAYFCLALFSFYLVVLCVSVCM